MNKEFDYTSKLLNVDEFLDKIKPGDKIFLGSGAAIPAFTVSEMLKSDKYNLTDLELIQLITLGKYLSENSLEGKFSNDVKYRLKTFNIGESISNKVKDGLVDFIPANLIEIPYIFASGAIGIDIAIIQTSPPNKRGFVNLGIAVDVANLAIKKASMVIAEVNPNVPITYGNTSLHIDQIDYIIESDYPLLERKRGESDSVLDRIGWNVANLIENNSTVALHAGKIFDAIAKHLVGKKNLGIYTNVISDWVIDLIESGTISIERSRSKGGLVTTSYCYGTRELYDYIDQNPIFEFYPYARLLSPFQLGRLGMVTRLISIMNVKQIDITGLSVLFHAGDNLLSGFESKMNFALGAVFSRKGKAIVALRSTDREGKSNIVFSSEHANENFKEILGIVRYVATEYGVVNLFGKSIRERVLGLIDIAHPDHRESLLEHAKENGYVYKDQIYNIESAVNYPLDLETIKTFKDGLELEFRPIKPTDEDNMRNLFYHFSDESKYLRYFTQIKVMRHKDMQKYVNVDYEKTLSIVAVLKNKRVEKIVAECRYAYYEKEDTYEMAFVVDENFHGKGIATFMINFLLKIGVERKLNEMSAYVLPENSKMMAVFKKAEFDFELGFEDGANIVKFDLRDKSISDQNSFKNCKGRFCE